MDSDIAVPVPDDIHLGRGAFAELVDWACERLDVGRIARDEVQRRAAAVDHLIGLGYQTGGLEVHHDGSERVDFLLHCNSRRTAFGDGVETPDWFGALIERTIDDEAAPAIEPADAATTDDTDHSDSGIVLPSQHWLEFDQAGESLILGGIWQAIRSDDGLDSASARSRLAEALSVTPLDVKELTRSDRLAHFIDHVGIPTQFGIMTGRSHRVKVFRRCDAARADDAVHFCSHPDLAETMAGLAAVGGLGTPESLIAALEGVVYGINIDLDLGRDRFPAGFGVELHQVSTAGEGLSSEIRELLLDAFGVDAAAVDDCQRIAAALPIGTRRRRSFGPFDQLVAPGLRHRVLVANHNHLKVVLHPERPPTVKTYVRLSVFQGLDSPDSEPSGRRDSDS